MRKVYIDSIEDERLYAYTKLTDLELRNRLEPEKGLFIAESPKVIDRALAAKVEPISFLVEKSWLEGMQETFREVEKQWGNDIPVFIASSEQLKTITGYRLHRGALAAMRRWKLPSLEEVASTAKRIAIMENIVDHANVGALIRSAAALDIDSVLVTPSCGDPLYRRAARVSMGTVFQVPWTRICSDRAEDWPKRGLAELKRLGFTTISLALQDDSLTLDELIQQKNEGTIDKMAFIFGTEGNGLSQQTIDESDLTVRIPMSHGVDSLNVAASSAVVFYATRK